MISGREGIYNNEKKGNEAVCNEIDRYDKFIKYAKNTKGESGALEIIQCYFPYVFADFLFPINKEKTNDYLIIVSYYISNHDLEIEKKSECYAFLSKWYGAISNKEMCIKYNKLKNDLSEKQRQSSDD